MAPSSSKDMQRLNYCITEIDAAYGEAAKRFGLSESAMSILYVLCNCGGTVLLSDIGKLLGMHKQTINSALRKLESEGVLYLEAFDGKKKKVCLTENGKALAQKTVLRLIQIENEIFDAWTEEERETHIRLTKKYLIHLQEKIKTL